MRVDGDMRVAFEIASFALWHNFYIATTEKASSSDQCSGVAGARTKEELVLQERPSDSSSSLVGGMAPAASLVRAGRERPAGFRGRGFAPHLSPC